MVSQTDFRFIILEPTNMKSIFESRTFWFAVAKFAVGVLALSTTYFGAYIPATIAGAILMVTSLIDIWLRANTSTAIAEVPPNSNP